MRADRLLAILLLLQARGGMSAPALAAELEVSVRTIYRDVDALSAAGVPVYADRGAAGGIRLMTGYRTDLTGLSAGEAQALFLLGLPGPLDDLGLEAQVGAAERKLLAALPASVRQDAERSRQRIHIDPAGWGRHPADILHLATVTRAVWDERRLQLVYTRGDGRRVERVVDPLGMVLKGGSWYLVAAVGEQVRTYRVSRVRSATVLEEGFVRPPGFDLVEHWKAVAADIEERTERVPVVVRVDGDFVPALPYVLGERIRALVDAAEPDADGSVRLEIDYYSLEEACTSLLGVGTHVEVLEPASLRDAVLRSAHAVVDRYQHGRAVPSGAAVPDAS